MLTSLRRIATHFTKQKNRRAFAKLAPLLLFLAKPIFAAVANPFGDVTSFMSFFVAAFIAVIAGLILILLAYKGVTAFASGRIVEGIFEVLGIVLGAFLAYSSRGWINSEFGTNF